MNEAGFAGTAQNPWEGRASESEVRVGSDLRLRALLKTRASVRRRGPKQVRWTRGESSVTDLNGPPTRPGRASEDLDAAAPGALQQPRAAPADTARRGRGAGAQRRRDRALRRTGAPAAPRRQASKRPESAAPGAHWQLAPALGARRGESLPAPARCAPRPWTWKDLWTLVGPRRRPDLIGPRRRTDARLSNRARSQRSDPTRTSDSQVRPSQTARWPVNKRDARKSPRKFPNRTY
jgi:hypothetical protein